MSKSSGDILTIAQLEEKGFDPMAYRYFIYSAHYRKPLTWSLEGLKSAQNAYKKAKNVVASLEDDGKENKKYLKDFEKAINDDLDMPGAIAVLWGLLRDDKAEGKVGAIKKMEEVLGLRLFEKAVFRVPAEIREIAEERTKARADKDWKKSDKLRDKLEKEGWKIKDSGDDFELEKL